MNSVKCQVRDQVWDQVELQFRIHVWRHVRDQVLDQVWRQVVSQVWRQVREELE